MPDPNASNETFLRISDGPETTSKVKGSRFVGQALRAHSLEHALERLQTIRKRYHDATHHCWAAAWGPPGATDERFDDDGEPSGSAGRPILHCLRGASVSDAVVVVTRWFGGTKLGTGGLVQAYSAAARLALDSAGRVQVECLIPVRIACSYEDLGGVEAILARRSAWTRSVRREFDSGPSFEVRVPKRRATALREEILEQLGGRPEVGLLPQVMTEN